jgi:1-acyl-sn-glycerol-3-phosphate acyltransferase
MTRALDYLLAFLVRAVTGIPLRDPLPGHDPELPALFYANHGSHLDSIVIWASIPPRWRRRFCVVAAADYWRPGSLRYRFARLLFDLTPVDRGPAVKPSRELLERLARPLEDGKSLLIFPEGTRSRDGGIGEFRGGLHYLACNFRRFRLYGPLGQPQPDPAQG